MLSLLVKDIKVLIFSKKTTRSLTVIQYSSNDIENLSHETGKRKDDLLDVHNFFYVYNLTQIFEKWTLTVDTSKSLTEFELFFNAILKKM